MSAYTAKQALLNGKINKHFPMVVLPLSGISSALLVEAYSLGASGNGVFTLLHDEELFALRSFAHKDRSVLLR